MSDSPTVKVRVILDGSQVPQQTEAIKAKAAELGPAVERSAGQATRALDSFGETAEQASERIKKMVRASLDSAQAEERASAVRGQATAGITAETAAIEANTAARASSRVAVDSLRQSFEASTQLYREAQAAMSGQVATLAEVDAKHQLLQKALAQGVITQSEYDKGLKALATSEAKLESEVRKLAAAYAPESSAVAKLVADEARLKAARDSGILTLQQYEKAMVGLTAKRAEIEGTASAFERLTLNTANTRREATLLVKDLATLDFSRAAREAGTLSANTGILRLAFTGLGFAVLSSVAAIGTFIGLVISGSNTQRDFEKALIASGEASGKTTSELIAQSKAIGQATGEYGAAREALTLLAKDGQLSGKAFDEAARGAVAFATVTGQSVEKAVEEFEKLGKEPLKVAVELNDKYHFLTAAVYDQIKALQEEGREYAASTLAIKTFAETMDSRRQQIVDTAGTIEKAWKSIKDRISESIQAVKDFGRTDDAALLEQAKQRLQNITATLNARADSPLGRFSPTAAFAGYGAAFSTEQLQADYDAERKLIGAIQQRIDKSRQANDEAAKQDNFNRQEVQANDAVDKLAISLDKQLAKQKAIAELNKQFASFSPNNPRLAGVSAVPGADLLSQPAFQGGLYDKLLADINQKYSDHGKAARQAAAGDREFADAMLKLANAADKNAATLDPLAQEEAKHVAALRQIVEWGAKAVEGAAKEGQLTARLPAIHDQVAKSINAENEAHQKNVDEINRRQDVVGQVLQSLDDEIEAHGKTAAAIAAETIVRNAVNKAISEKAKLSPQEIADLRNEVTAREALLQALDYTDKLKANNAQLIAEAKARGELSPLQKAELEIAKLMPDLLKKNWEERQKVVTAMREQAAEQQILEAGASLSSTVSSLFDSVALSVQSGENVWHAFGKAAEPVIGKLGQDLGKLIEGLKNANHDTAAWGDTVASLKDDAKAALPAIGQLAGAIIATTGGGDAQIKAALGGAISGAIQGAANGGGWWGAAIGAVVGAISGYLSAQEKAPAIYLNSGAGSHGRDRSAPIQTPFGYISSDTDNLADSVYKTVENTVKGFDQQLARLFDPATLDKVTARLATFSGKWNDIDSLLQARLDAILSVMDKGVADFVNGFATDLQGRVQALADVLTVKRIVDTGTSFVDNLQDALNLISKFGQAGETVAATYNRLAVAAASWITAMGLMGYSMEGTKAEIADFAAQISDAGATAQESATLWDSYFKHFYTQQEINAEKIKELQKRVADSFAKIGEDPTESLAKFRADFEAALPTLTPDQILEWLRAGDALGQLDDAIKATGGEAGDAASKLKDLEDQIKANKQAYLDSLQAQADYLSTMDAVQNELYGAADGATSYRAAVANVRLWEQQTIDTLNQAAIAAGEQGAAESDLALVHQLAAQRIVNAMQALITETQDLVARLNSGDLGAAANDAANAQIEQINRVADAADNLYQRQLQSIQSIQDYLDSQLLGDTSALTPAQKIAEAFRQLQATQAAALGGDATAAAKLPQLADAYLRLLQGAEASGADYNTGVAQVRALLQAVVNQGPLATPGGNGGSSLTDAGLAQHDQQVAASMAEQRKELALQLAQHLRDLSQGLGVPLEKIIQTEGYSLDKLAKDVGVDLNHLTGQSVLSLAQLASALGLDLQTLTQDLGKNLTDLGGGIAELEKQLGIDMSNLSGAQVETLNSLAQTLGLSLTDLVSATGNNLSDLATGLTELETSLGIDFQNMTGSQVVALAGLATELGLSLSDLVTATGNNLGDLAGGLTQLTSSLGIDLENLTTGSVESLANLAYDLGTNLDTLERSLGLNLGDLADKQSLLNQALADTIDGLPDLTRDQLAPLLNAITSATTEADANLAIENLKTAVEKLPADQSNKLAPYFDGIFPKKSADDLDFLQGIYDYGKTQVDKLGSIATSLNDIYSYGLDVSNFPKSFDVFVKNWDEANSTGGSFAVGSAYISEDMTAKVHAGEAIIDANSAGILRRYGIQVSSTHAANDAALVAEVRALREEVAELRKDTRMGAGSVADAVKLTANQAEKQRERNADKIAKAAETKGRSTRYG